MKVKYQSNDGKLFDTPEEALKHEVKLAEKTEDWMQKFLRMHHGRQLLREHSLDEEGFWHVFGEDTNAELQGPHHTPDLGIYEGKLGDVLRVAVTLKGFWSWGGGGEIRKANITSVKVPDEQAQAPMPAPENDEN